MDIMEQLRAPFAPEDIDWRVGQTTRNGEKVSALAYLTSRAVQQRLDDVFGPFGWATKYVKGPDGGVVCELSCKGPDGQWVTKSDGSPNTDIEAVKGGLSSALKRAAVHWGIGRYLYDLPMVWCQLKPKGQIYHRSKSGQGMYWDPPKLPAWALPKKAGAPAATKPNQETGMDEWREAIESAPSVEVLMDLGKDLASLDVGNDLKAPLRRLYTERMIALKGQENGE